MGLLQIFYTFGWNNILRSGSNKIKQFKKTVITMTKQTVVCSDGEIRDRNVCRLIGGNYYHIGDVNKRDSGGCYLIESKEGSSYFRHSSPRLFWNSSKNKYEAFQTDYIGERNLSGENIVYAISSVEKRNVFFEHFLEPDVNKVVLGSRMFLVSKKFDNVIEHIIWNPNDAKYYFDWEINIKDIEDDLNTRVGKPRYSRYPSDVYNSGDHSAFSTFQAFMETSNNNNPSIVKPLDSLFTGRTMGVEIEVASGSYPENDLLDDGLLPLKDGSIPGHEYASVVLKNNFVEWFDKVFSKLSKYTRTNQNCSLHLHIGGINADKKRFAVAAYMLWQRLQDEIRGIIPPYKYDVKFLSGKQGGPKDHCKPLMPLFKKSDSVEDCFNKLLLF